MLVITKIGCQSCLIRLKQRHTASLRDLIASILPSIQDVRELHAAFGRLIHPSGFHTGFSVWGGGGISIYEKEGCVMRKRGVGDKSLCQ